MFEIRERPLAGAGAGLGRVFCARAGRYAAEFSELGAALLSYRAPDAEGAERELIVAPYDEGAYAGNPSFFGATVGRYANRIADASFLLDGRRYRLDANDGPNQLHGGAMGLSWRAWSGRAWVEGGRARAEFRYDSPDGEGGYPGRVAFVVRYTLDEEGFLKIEHRADAELQTPLSMTGHAYFNLDGGETVAGHLVALRSSSYLELDDGLIPTGRRVALAGGPDDFRTPSSLEPALRLLGGIDRYYEFDASVPGAWHDWDGLRHLASIGSGARDMKLEVYSDLPGAQFYTGKYLRGTPLRDNRPGGTGAARSAEAFAGLCVEPSYYPDGPNHGEFPGCVFGPDRPYRHAVAYRASPMRRSERS